jgi:hypothetical protein
MMLLNKDTIMKKTEKQYSFHAIATIEFSAQIIADSPEAAKIIFEESASTFAKHDAEAQIYNVYIDEIEQA